MISVLGPQFANQLGWFSAEIGRQPFIVYNLLRTEDAFSKTISAGEVITSLVFFVIIYLMLAALFIYLLNDKIQHGPVDEQVKEGYLA